MQRVGFQPYICPVNSACKNKIRYVKGGGIFQKSPCIADSKGYHNHRCGSYELNCGINPIGQLRCKYEQGK